MDIDLITLLQLALFTLLLGCSAFFSSSETALFSLNASEIERMRMAGHPRLELIQRLLSEPRRLIITILIGNELVNVAASNISAILLIRFFGGEENWWVNIVVMLPLLLLVGEITPKSLAVRHNAAFGGFVSRPLEMFAWLITPLRWVVRQVADFFITLMVGEGRKRGNLVTEDMVRTLASQATREGVLDQAEGEFIQNIFDFGDQRVGEVMTPRARVLALPLDMSFAEITKTMRRRRLSRVPMYREDRDMVVGMLHLRDLLGRDLSQIRTGEDLVGMLRKPLFVPESRLAVDLFHSFLERKQSIALVVDEFGGITGLVSMDDLLQIIFGESAFGPHQVEEALVIAEDTFRVDGAMSVEAFNQQMHASLDERVAQTMAGLVLHLHGELPEKGVEVRADGWRLRVERVERNRILEIVAIVQASPLVPPPPPLAEAAEAVSHPDPPMEDRHG